MHRPDRLASILCLLLVLPLACDGESPANGSSPSPTDPGSPTPAPTPTEQWGTQPDSGEGEATAASPAELTGISTDQRESYDRVTFSFADALPDFRAEYVDQIQEPGSGAGVDLRGNRPMRMTLTNVAPVGGEQLTPELPAVREVRPFPTFEGTVESGIGLAGASQLPFRVQTNGQELVLDIALPDPASPTGPPTGSPTATETASPAPPGSPSLSPTSPDASSTLRRGDSGEQVEALQRQLKELGYWLGPVDGVLGPLTEQAVYALQKAAGIARDGIVGPDTRSALEEGARPSARSEDGHVAEVDLDRQLLMLVDDGHVSHIFNTSTGTFEHYWYDGERYLADTPRGHWEIYRQVDGWDPGPLGRLYKPKYFQEQGIAVHGYTNVPPYPASHGCVRVTLPAIDWMWSNDQLPIGTPVWVY